MGVVEQAPEFLVGFELRLLMGRRLDRVLEVVVVDQGRDLGHHRIHLLLGVQIHAIVPCEFRGLRLLEHLFHPADLFSEGFGLALLKFSEVYQLPLDAWQF